MTSPNFDTTLLKFNSPTAELRTSGRASSRAGHRVGAAKEDGKRVNDSNNNDNINSNDNNYNDGNNNNEEEITRRQKCKKSYKRRIR